MFRLLALLATALAVAHCLDSYHPPVVALLQAIPTNGNTLMAYTGGEPLFIRQDGLEVLDNDAAYVLLQRLCRLVAVQPGNYSEVWCSPDGVRWAWLRWLPLRHPAVWRGVVGLTNANITVCTPIGNFTAAVPPGWYTDGRRILRVPAPEAEEAYAALLKEEELRRRAEALTRRVAQLEEELKKAEEETRACASRVSSAETEVALLQAELETARADTFFKTVLAIALGVGLAVMVALKLLRRDSF